MTKLKDQLVQYLKENDGWVASGDLQRIYWPKYAYGVKKGYHTPRSVVRRLEELAAEKKIHVEQRNNHSWYCADLTPPRRMVIELRDNVAYQKWI